MNGKLEHVTFHCGSAKERLQNIEAESIQCCITSPPYWGLRDYDAEGQLGLEPTPKEYIEDLVEVFGEVRRVLRPDGTLWLNLGDSYLNKSIDGYEKQKDLVGIPWRVATALQKDGWYLRSDIIWRKLGTMPSSIKDRPTPSHEYIFLLTKDRKYYYDHEAIKEPVSSSAAQKFSPEGKPKKSKRDVWEVSTGASDFGHFACVDEKTEILTKSGWQTHKNLSKENKIATFHTNSETIHYHKPYSIHKYEYSGEMYRIKNKWIDQLVTPNHRVLLKYRRSGYKDKDDEWNYQRADSLRPHSGIMIPNSGKYGGNLKLSKEKAELLGWIITEGSVNRHKSIKMWQSKSANPEKVDRIRTLLQKSSQNFKEHTRSRQTEYGKSTECNFALNKTMNDNSWIWEWLKEDLTPKWKLLHVSQECLRALYEGIVEGDGHKREDGRHSFIQHDKYTREWFVVLATHLGKRVTHTPQKKTVYVTHQNYSNIHSSYFNKVVVEEEYEGVVWCPETPNTNFIAKRNDKIFVTGNTFPLDLIEPCVKAGTSAFGQCKNCGAPYKRVLEENKVKRKREERFTESKFQNAGGRRGCSQDHLGTTSETIGWESTCECGGEETERQTVLDPFAGASTTGIAALKHDRKFVGVEINPDYIELSKDRIREHEEVPANHSFW